jgi:hypothetical protein
MTTKNVKSVKNTSKQSKSNKSATVVAQQNVAAAKSESVTLASHSNNIAFTDKRPGVVAHILEMLMNASAESAITKTTILAALVKRFANRAESGMKATLMMQCPSGLLIEKRVVVATVKNEATKERSYYVDRELTAKAQAAYAAELVASKSKTLAFAAAKLAIA